MNCGAATGVGTGAGGGVVYSSVLDWRGKILATLSGGSFDSARDEPAARARLRCDASDEWDAVK